MLNQWWARAASGYMDAATAVMGGGSLLGGVMSSGAAKDAASTQADAASQAAAAQLQATRETNAMQQSMYDQARADQSPWRTAGTGALSKLSQLLGVDTPSNPNAASNLPALQRQYNDSLTTYNNLLNSSAGGGGSQLPPAYQSALASYGAQPAGWDGDYLTLIMAQQAQQAQQGQGGYGGGQYNQAAINAAKANLDSLKAQIDAMQGQSQDMAPRGSDFGSFNHQFGASDFQADPGYQFTRKQGELALDRANASKGRYASGAALKDLLSFNTGLANQTYDNAFNRYQTDLGNRFGRLSSLAGIGQAATNQVSQLGANTANNIASNTMSGTASANNSLLSGAAARASGYVGSANAIGGGIGNASSMYMMSKLPMFNTASGGGSPYGNSYSGFDNPANYG